MKVLHIVESFSALSETFIYDYITELEKQGIDNHVLTFERLNEVDRPFDKVYVVKLRKKLIWFLSGVLLKFNVKPSILWGRQRRRVKKIIVKVKPDIVHAQFGPMGVITHKVTTKLKIPLFVTFHGYDISILLNDKFWLSQYHRLFENSCKIIGVSNDVCRKIEQVGCPKEKIIRFSVGIKLENFKFRKTILKKDNEVNLIHIGRLVEKKSPILLIKAFKIVFENYKERIKLKLIIIGDGPLKEEAMNLANELGVSQQVKFMGALKHEEIIKYLTNSQIYTQHCITAPDGDQEGLGMTFLEASAVGLPVVATNHDGIPDAVINNKTGFLVTEGDYEEMANKIIYLIENKDVVIEFGKNGRKYVEDNFNIHKQILKAIKYYKDCIISLLENDSNEFKK